MKCYSIVALITLMAFTLTACGGSPLWLPRAHKIVIQQGNLINEDQLAQIELGMAKELVRSLIGTPVVDTPFRNNRWDYLFTRGPAGSSIQAQRVSIYFDESDLVSNIESNRDQVSGEKEPPRYWWERLAKNQQ